MALRLLTLLGTHPKHLVIDQSLSSSLNNLIPFSQLRQQCNVTTVHWFHELNTEIEGSRTILIKSDLKNVKQLRRWISHDCEVIITDDYYQSFVETMGPGIPIKVWKLHLESDTLIQLNIKEWDSLYLYKTPNLVSKLSSLLSTYLIENGLHVKESIAKGLNSNRFVQSLKSAQQEYVTSLPLDEKSQFLKLKGKSVRLIVLERNLDFLSIVLRQLNYSGIIDDILGIEIDHIHKLRDSDDIYLNDDVYEELRSLNFGIAVDLLNKKAKELQTRYDHLVKQQVSNQFVEELKQLESAKKNMSKNTAISELIISKTQNEVISLEQEILVQNISYSSTIAKLLDFIYQGVDILVVLRLLCVTSIVHNGIREKDYRILSSELIDTYGIQYSLKLQELLKVGLIGMRGDPSIIKNFNQYVQEFGVMRDDDMFYGGYVPLLKRVLDLISKGDSIDWGCLMGKLSIEFWSGIQNGPDGSNGANSVNGLCDGGKWNESIIIVMIGGVTYSELESIRKLNKSTGQNVKVITDGMISAKDVLSL